MKLKTILLSLLASFALLGAEYDVVIYGGSSGGVIAAVAAANNGKTTLIIEPSAHVGGLTTNGLGHVDIMHTDSLGGLTMEFFKQASAETPAPRMFFITPKFSENVFLKMLKDAKVEVIYSTRLAEKNGVTKVGDKIKSITLEDGQKISGEIFIDASYEGDLLAQAGVQYRVGREGVAEYNESGAGVRQAYSLPYAEAYDEDGKLLPGIVVDDFGTVGEADDLTQAYNFRLCMTQDKSNFKKVEKPADYDPKNYRNLLNYINSEPDKKWTFNDFISYWAILSGGTKVDVNNRGNFSTDVLNYSHTWAEASYKEREELYEYHKNFTLGFLYFLANDPNVPEYLRQDCASWGLAADEFVDNDNWPYLLYVREARRMVGEYVMVQQDAFENSQKEDTIGVGSYMLDSHGVRRFVAPDGKVYMEGFIGHVPVRPYDIAYRSIIPKREDCTNLFSVICFSASHVAYSSLRMEPVFMTDGEAAGEAAAMAIDNNIAVQDVDVKKLQEKLLANGGIISSMHNGNVYPLLSEIGGYAVDNSKAKLSGKWNLYYGGGKPIINGNYYMAHSKEPSTATYTWSVPETGEYSLSVLLPRRKSGHVMPVTFKHNETEKTVEVDIANVGIIEETLLSFTAQKGDVVEVIFSSDGTKTAVADCIVFRKK